MRSGFTLIEVVVALVVLQIAVLGVAGLLELASETLVRADALESAVAAAEGVLDSLLAADSARSGSRGFPGGQVRWSVDSLGAVALAGTVAAGDTVLVLSARARSP